MDSLLCGLAFGVCSALFFLLPYFLRSVTYEYTGRTGR